MKFVKIIVLLIILSSCSSKKSVVGLYGKCGKKYLACTQIELKIDNTFEYYIFNDVGGGTILKGNWTKTAHNNIFLNTTEQPTNPEINYTGKFNKKLVDKIIIGVFDNEGPIIGAAICLNDNNNCNITNENGIVEFPSQELDSITYSYLNQSENVQIKDSSHNEFHLTIKDLDIDAVSKYLINEKVLFENNTLIFNPSKHWFMFSLKKTGIKNKKWNKTNVQQRV